MTGNEVLKLAYDLMSEEESSNTEFTGYAPGILTVLLAETFPLNNGLRESRGLAPMEEMPTVTAETMDRELTYEPEVQRTVLPYGLCAKYADGDGDAVKTGYYNSLYVSACNACLRGIPQEDGVVDVYYFNPPTPCGVGPLQRRSSPGHDRISIHPPHAGWDSKHVQNGTL